MQAQGGEEYEAWDGLVKGRPGVSSAMLAWSTAAQTGVKFLASPRVLMLNSCTMHINECILSVDCSPRARLGARRKCQ